MVSPDFWRGKRVLLTGHTGFKGGWLALWLHRLGALESYRWDGRQLLRDRAVASDEGLPAVESGGLMVDSAGVVWLATPRGLLRFDPS